MKSNIVPDSNAAAEFRAKEESTNYLYELFFFKAKDASQSKYRVFDQNGTKQIGFLRRAKGSNQHSIQFNLIFSFLFVQNIYSFSS